VDNAGADAKPASLSDKHRERTHEKQRNKRERKHCEKQRETQRQTQRQTQRKNRGGARKACERTSSAARLTEQTEAPTWKSAHHFVIVLSNIEDIGRKSKGIREFNVEVYSIFIIVVIVLSSFCYTSKKSAEVPQNTRWNVARKWCK